jgi:hypothetical protein
LRACALTVAQPTLDKLKTGGRGVMQNVRYIELTPYLCLLPMNNTKAGIEYGNCTKPGPFRRTRVVA